MVFKMFYCSHMYNTLFQQKVDQKWGNIHRTKIYPIFFQLVILDTTGVVTVDITRYASFISDY